MKTRTLLLFLTVLIIACGPSHPEAKEKIQQQDTVSKAVVPEYNPATGLPEGENTIKYPSGAVQMKGEVLQGKRHGTWTTWRENGMKWSESVYNLGVLEGKTVSFHENGQVNYIGYYVNGKKNGKWVFYSPEGELIKEQVYK